MRTKNRPIEVLAPAGSMECLKAAILNGADAVYLGGEMFGARAYAGNFNKEELLEAIDYVHLYGKKLFLTVNTLMKEEELPLLPGFLKPFYEQGLDAVIVQDLGAVSVIRKHFPKLDDDHRGSWSKDRKENGCKTSCSSKGIIFGRDSGD